LIAGAISEERVGDVGRLHRPRVWRIDRIERGRAHRVGMQRNQGHGDGRAVGFAVDVPALDPKRPPNPFKIGDGDAGAEILQIEAACGRLSAARRIGGQALGQSIVCRVRCDGDGGIEERAVEVRAEVRLRSAGSPLVDEDDIAAWGVGGAALVVGVDGEGTCLVRR